MSLKTVRGSQSDNLVAITLKCGASGTKERVGLLRLVGNCDLRMHDASLCYSILLHGTAFTFLNTGN
jgi:hypothetical protein